MVTRPYNLNVAAAGERGQEVYEAVVPYVDTMSDERVKSFVRKALGCDCAEDVFKHIENEHDVKVDDVILKNKINVGNRLLVYIAEMNGPEAIHEHLEALVKAGKKERDTKQFNRFRLVIATHRLADISKAAAQEFKKAPELDEKVHLHVIDEKDVSDI